MPCPDCGQTNTELLLRNCDDLFVPPEMRPAGLFARVLRCWECGYSNAIYTTLTIRLVTIADAGMLYEWRNDPETRAQSFDTNPLDYDRHVSWIQALLQITFPRPVAWWIGEIDHIPVGTVRLGITTPAEINLIVAPQWRGVGISAALLAACPIPNGTQARVKGNNHAIRKALEYAGWTQQEVSYAKANPSLR